MTNELIFRNKWSKPTAIKPTKDLINRILEMDIDQISYDDVVALFINGDEDIATNSSVMQEGLEEYFASNGFTKEEEDKHMQVAAKLQHLFKRKPTHKTEAVEIPAINELYTDTNISKDLIDTNNYDLYKLLRKSLTNDEGVKDKMENLKKLKRVRIQPNFATERLEELGFDPMKALVDRYHEMELMLDMMRTSKKRSFVAESSIYATLQKTSTDLLKYGYFTKMEAINAKRIKQELPPPKSEEEIIKIILTDNLSKRIDITTDVDMPLLPNQVALDDPEDVFTPSPDIDPELQGVSYDQRIAVEAGKDPFERPQIAQPVATVANEEFSDDDVFKALPQ